MNPWETEPDVLRFNSHGLRCIIIRNRHMKHLCGYVQLPYGKLRDRAAKRNRLRYKWVCDMNEFCGFEVHGGLTFFGSPGHYRAKRGKWLGFDCAHFYDLVPGLIELLPMVAVTSNVFKDGTYRTIEYVRQETEHLAEQIAALAWGNNG